MTIDIANGLNNETIISLPDYDQESNKIILLTVRKHEINFSRQNQIVVILRCSDVTIYTTKYFIGTLDNDLDI